MKPLLGLALATLAGSAGAAAPLADDQIVASFVRMFEHEPTPTAPISLAALERQGSDPLIKAVNLVLWKQDPPQYHVTAQASASQPIRR